MDRATLKKTHKIWRLSRREKRYVDSLPPEERSRATSYLTGYKLMYDDRKKTLPNFETMVETREKRGPKWVNYFVNYVSKRQNPFYLFLQEQGLDKYDIMEEEDQIGLFLLGYQLVNLDAKLTKRIANRELVRCNDPGAFIQSMVSFAKKMLNELTPQYFMPKRPPRPSRKGSHTKHKDQDQGHDLSPPTTRDVEHINDYLEGLNKGRNWLFEETIYQRGNLDTDPLEPKRRIVHLIATVNGDGVLEKRMAVKVEGFHSPESVEVAREEYRIHRDLTEIESHAFLDCYGHSIRTRKPLRRDHSPTHLLYGYLEFAPFGTLYELADAARTGKYYLPEYFLWMVFHSLATALIHLDLGPMNPLESVANFKGTNDSYRTRHKADGWRSLVNLDIKSTNVVLSAPHPDYPAFPVAKMMDFGLCFRHSTSTVDRYRPDVEDTMGGTHGWMSPEQLQRNGTIRRRDYNDSIGDAIGPHLHVFSAGLIMLNLMDRCIIPHQDNKRAPRHRKGYDGMYSARLDNLVDQCVELVPAERPTLPQLLKRTREGMRAAGERAGVNPYGREERELEVSMRVRGLRGREPAVGAFMGQGWRYANKRRRVMEEGGEGTGGGEGGGEP